MIETRSCYNVFDLSPNFIPIELLLSRVLRVRISVCDIRILYTTCVELHCIIYFLPDSAAHKSNNACG